MRLLRLTIFVLLTIPILGCASSANTYMVFAQTATEDKDAILAPTIRLPLEDQPNGATVFCQNQNFVLTATRRDDDQVVIQKFDGSRQVVDLPLEKVAVGLTTLWPDGSRATSCGLTLASPLGSHATIEWLGLKINVRRDQRGAILYTLDHDQSVVVRSPLTPRDRQFLLSRGVPRELAELLY